MKRLLQCVCQACSLLVSRGCEKLNHNLKNCERDGIRRGELDELNVLKQYQALSTLFVISVVSLSPKLCFNVHPEWTDDSASLQADII